MKADIDLDSHGRYESKVSGNVLGTMGAAMRSVLTFVRVLLALPR